MVDVAEIIGQYERHGWKLRRVLLSPDLAASLDRALFGDAEIAHAAEGSGLWFSRRSQPGHEAWELRRISAAPFAIVELVPDGLTDEERDGLLSAAESRMFDPARREGTSH